MATKIDWCDDVWNPVWGCKRGCPYCYAKKIANRFSYDIPFEEIRWMPNNYEKPLQRIKPTIYFVNSMSDIEYWNLHMFLDVKKMVDRCKQHTFLFLTKNPKAIKPFDDCYPDNCWFGVSATNDMELHFNTLEILKFKHKKFVSIEPLLSKISQTSLAVDLKEFDWVIVGAETGNRKGKVMPKIEWMQSITDACSTFNIPLFMKGSLSYMGNLLQEYPKQFHKES